MRRQEYTWTERIIQGLFSSGVLFLMTSLPTIIFLCLVLIFNPELRHVGSMVIIGLFFTWITVFFAMILLAGKVDE
jgi:hypothetical protein